MKLYKPNMTDLQIPRNCFKETIKLCEKNYNSLWNFISQIWQTFKFPGTVFANLAWYRRTKDLVPLFDPKVHILENSLLKILAQLTIKVFISIDGVYS